MKKVLIAVGVLLVLLVVGALILYGKLDSLVEHAVEKYGSQATQTSVELESAKVEVTAGKATLSGLKIANPKGYTAPHAFEMGSIMAGIDAGTITSDTVVISEVVIDGPRVWYEVGLGGSNLGTIQSNIAAFKGEAKVDNSGGKKFIIKDLRIREGRVQGSVTSPVGGRDVSAKLPEIHLRDIGTGQGGATPAQIAAQVLDALVDAAMRSAAELALKDPQGLGQKAKDALKGVLGK